MLVQADTDGWVAAGFTHRTSRAGDPQLHTHVLVANKVRACTDGRWLALDGRELYQVQKAAGLVYKAGLRAELTARLGVAWSSVDRDGGGEIAGTPVGLIGWFSKRRQQVIAHGTALIAEREAKLGRSLTAGERAEVFQLATYQTRTAKADGERSTDELRARWRYEAATAEYLPEQWLAEVLGRRRAGRPARGWAARLVRQVLADLEEQHSTWGRTDVVEAVAVRVPPGWLVDAEAVRVFVEQAADAVLGDQEVVRLGADPTVVPAALARRDGMAPGERHGGIRYSTRRVLEAEQSILAAVEAGRHAGVAIVTPRAVGQAVERCGLGADQAEAVQRLCTAGERVAVLVGPAGAGKSRALGAARLAWQQSNVRVRGVAPSAVAAGVLSEQAGIPAETVAKFLLDAAHGRVLLQPGEVIVCDEASMLATQDLARLVVMAGRAQAKLVLVGDPKQLGSVDAGGLFRLLAADARTAELTAIRRFADPWEADASRRLRAGDVTVIGEYVARGRVVGSSREGAVDAAYHAVAGRPGGRFVSGGHGPRSRHRQPAGPTSEGSPDRGRRSRTGRPASRRTVSWGGR